MKINNIKKYLTKSLDKAKMFANIAVLSILKGGTTRRKLSGIFCTLLLVNFGFVTPCIVVRLYCSQSERQREVRESIKITVSTPVWSVNAPTAFEVDSNGKAKPFSFFAQKITNSTVMLSTEKNLQGVKHSNPLASNTQKNLKKLLKEVSKQVTELQQENNFLRFYVERYGVPHHLARFEKENPVNSQNWEKLLQQEKSLNELF